MASTGVVIFAVGLMLAVIGWIVIDHIKDEE